MGKYCLVEDNEARSSTAVVRVVEVDRRGRLRANNRCVGEVSFVAFTRWKAPPGVGTDGLNVGTPASFAPTEPVRILCLGCIAFGTSRPSASKAQLS